MFFAIFWIFLKIYQNMGQKLGSNTFNIYIFFCNCNLPQVFVTPSLQYPSFEFPTQ
jgi:hypothetical protein